jgi:hypothetical protein
MCLVVMIMIMDNSTKNAKMKTKKLSSAVECIVLWLYLFGAIYLAIISDG